MIFNDMPYLISWQQSIVNMLSGVFFFHCRWQQSGSSQSGQQQNQRLDIVQEMSKTLILGNLRVNPVGSP